MQNYLEIGIDKGVTDRRLQTLVIGLGERISSVVPAGSLVRLTVDTTKSLCSVFSQQLSFRADSINQDPFGALREIESALLERITLWRDSRFQESL